MATRVVQVDPEGEESERASALTWAARALRAGKLVAFPTETVYGVAAMAEDPRAVRRLQQLKDRPKGPFTVHLPARADAGRYVCEFPLRARALMRKAWPGPVTMVVATGGRAAHPQPLDKALYDRIVRNGRVGLRCPSDLVAGRLLAAAGGAVLATSANLAGRPAATDAGEVLAQLEGKVDLLLDAGPTHHRACSTIVEFRGEECRVVRAGVYGAGAIRRLCQLVVLFVCTGNTCRSPMAAALARKTIAERMGCEASELAKAGVRVVSAGTFALGGTGASPEAVRAVRELGASMGRHRAGKLTEELIRDADVIFCMTRRHVAEVTRRAASAAGKTFVLDVNGDIGDPIGGGDDEYLQVARRIAGSFRKRLKENWL